MRLALAEAHKAQKKGEVPVGAVCVFGDRVLSRGHNQPLRRSDPTAHAEIIALRKAGLKIKNYRLLGCDLFVTVEPCAMCLGASIQSRIKRLVYGAPDVKAGAVQSMMKFPLERTNHRLEVRGGVLQEECGRVLKSFFRERRKKPGK